MKRFIYLGFILISLAVLTSCKKDTEDPTPPQQHTLNLQVSNNPTETHLFGGVGIDESGPCPDLSACTWTKGGVRVDVRSIVQFDLGSIPSNATIVSAKLTLYSTPDPLEGNLVDANSGADNSMYISKVASAWDPVTANWTNQPLFSISNEVLVPHTDLPFFDLVDIDVKDLVSSMVSGPNYGFMIRLQHEDMYTCRQFCSSFNADVTRQPKLDVVYQ